MPGNNRTSTLLAVYSRAGDAWLLVPRCARPSSDVVAAHGPLRYAGEFPWSRLSSREHSIIAAEIAMVTFARIPSYTARRMMTRRPLTTFSDSYFA
jgi:hypothetical protein